GGANAAAVLGILPGLARPDHEIVFLHVRRPGSRPARELLDRILDAVAKLQHVEARETFADDPFEAIVEASRAHDLLVLGASNEGRTLPDTLLDVVRRSACPAIVVRAESTPRRPTREGPRALV